MGPPKPYPSDGDRTLPLSWGAWKNPGQPKPYSWRDTEQPKRYPWGRHRTTKTLFLGGGAGEAWRILKHCWTRLKHRFTFSIQVFVFILIVFQGTFSQSWLTGMKNTSPCWTLVCLSFFGANYTNVCLPWWTLWLWIGTYQTALENVLKQLAGGPYNCV